MPSELVELDPFDLPEWLGEGQVVWSADTSVRIGHLVTGVLLRDGDGSAGAPDGTGGLPCDLLAVDHAYPAPVADDAVRAQAHLSWRHHEVLLVTREGRATLAVPGYYFNADRVLDALERLARAVGAHPERYAARLRVGSDRGA